MEFETDRLLLVPLKPNQLYLWLDDISALEKELSCTYSGEPLDDFMHKIVRGQAEISEKNPDNYLWDTFWWIIKKDGRIVVGSSDFKKAPDENGDVEIGYGLEKCHEHHGYMTETVLEMCRFAFEHGAQRVIAETENWNSASQRVLVRCGFERYSEGETMWWEKKKEK